MRLILLFVIIAPTFAYAGDGNRLIRTMPDGGRVYSKHSLVGQCKISDGTVLLCASSGVNDEFNLKYDGYWFSGEHEDSLYGTKKTVTNFKENTIATCIGKLSKSKSGEVVVGPPNRNNDFESICVINKADADQVIASCKIGQQCRVVGYVGADCEGECANIAYLISINGKQSGGMR